MIQENREQSVPKDVISLLHQLIPSGIGGPRMTIPVVDGKMGLSTRLNIFLCECDRPHSNRPVMVTVLSGKPQANIFAAVAFLRTFDH